MKVPAKEIVASYGVMDRNVDQGDHDWAEATVGEEVTNGSD